MYEQIAHRETDFIPYVLPMEDTTAEALDVHYGSKEWRTKLDSHVIEFRLAKLPWETAGSRAKGPYGTVWRTDLRRAHLEVAPLSEPSLSGYTFPSIDELLVENWEDKVRQARKQYSDHFLVVGCGSGPFERSWYLRGMENALADAVTEPDFYEELICTLTDHQLQIIERVLDSPADGMMMGDDWAYQKGVFLGPERWRRFLKPNLKRIYERIHAAGKITVTHCCGSIVDIMPDVIEIGLDVLESVQPEAMDPYMLKREYGRYITFWGGLGSQSVLSFGTPVPPALDSVSPASHSPPQSSRRHGRRHGGAGGRRAGRSRDSAMHRARYGRVLGFWPECDSQNWPEAKSGIWQFGHGYDSRIGPEAV